MAGKRKPPVSSLDLVDEALSAATNNDVLEMLKRTLESIAVRASATADLVCDDGVPREALFEARLFVDAADELMPRGLDGPRWKTNVWVAVKHAKESIDETFNRTMRAAVDA